MWSDKGADPWVVEVLWWGYLIPFCTAPSFVLSLVHQVQDLGGRGSRPSSEDSRGACSISVSRLLLPSFCGDEGLRVLETGHQPFSTDFESSNMVEEDSLGQPSEIKHIIYWVNKYT